MIADLFPSPSRGGDFLRDIVGIDPYESYPTSVGGVGGSAYGTPLKPIAFSVFKRYNNFKRR